MNLLSLYYLEREDLEKATSKIICNFCTALPVAVRVIGLVLYDPVRVTILFEGLFLIRFIYENYNYFLYFALDARISL